MHKILTVYKQEKWHNHGDVEIREGGNVTVNGTSLTTDNEIALANIVLRLNATTTILREGIEKLKETIDNAEAK